MTFEKNYTPWNKGTPWPEEMRLRFSAANKGKPSWNKGRSMSAESKAKLAEAHRGIKLSPETRARMSAAHMNRPPTMLGRNHTLEARQKMSRRHLGNKYCLGFKHSEETKRKVAIAAKTNALKHSAKDLPNCGCAFHRTCYSSKLEEILVTVLLAEFPIIERQRWFGRYRVDAYLPPPYHLAFEADGEYWHRDKKESDAYRDRLLLKKFGLPVVRLTESEIRDCLRAQ